MARAPLVSGGIAGTYNLRPTDIRLAPIRPRVDRRRRQRQVDNIAFWQGGVRAARPLARRRAAGRGVRAAASAPAPLARTAKFWGGYVQASYFILPHRLQVAGRVGRSDQPTYGVPDAELRAAAAPSSTSKSVAVSAYLRGHHAKLQVDYSPPAV